MGAIITLESAGAPVGGAPDLWLLGAGATKWQALAANDGDTTYVASTTLNDAQAVTPQILGGLYTINSVKVRTVGRQTVANSISIKPAIYRGATEVLDGSAAQFYSDTAYHDYTSAALSRPGGGSWTFADFDGSGTRTCMGIKVFNVSVGNAFRCSYVQLVLDINVGGSDIVMLGVQ